MSVSVVRIRERRVREVWGKEILRMISLIVCGARAFSSAFNRIGTGFRRAEASRMQGCHWLIAAVADLLPLTTVAPSGQGDLSTKLKNVPRLYFQSSQNINTKKVQYMMQPVMCAMMLRRRPRQWRPRWRERC